ncbi:unnamed protein product [marine sediment metagenome]|uniref:Uncharacterized protein n=1 Tax=marine sediment metagenome TaxID=412755 RepID=X1I3V9_9ZZZZ
MPKLPKELVSDVGEPTWEGRPYIKKVSFSLYKILTLLIWD